jgi:hypothetical protein
MSTLEIGKFYNWKHQTERLVYLGSLNCWHQFALRGTTEIWCEVAFPDLHMLEETTTMRYIT